MKKRLSLALLLMTVISIGFFAINYRTEFEYNSAKRAYKSGEDVKAFNLAQKVYKTDITNDKYRSFYLSTIKRLEVNYDAQEALLEFIDDGVYDVYQSEAEMYLSELKDIIEEEYSPSYIKLVPFNNKVVRWSTMPIKVGIVKRDDLDIYFINEVQRAFLEWQKAVDAQIQFEFTDKNSDILIEFQEIPKDVKEKNKYRLYIVANTEPEFDENKLRKMRIVFYTKNNQDEYFTKEEIYNTALHEIAHALGVCGHSKHPDDVLYFSSSNISDKVYHELSENDINTMRLLYQIKPDVSNGVGNFTVHPKLIFGEENEINDVKYQEAKTYIKQAPKLPNGYINLAQTAMYTKDYESAKSALKEAIKYANDDNTKFIIYYNFAVICYEMDDMNKALFYAEKAQEFRSRSSVTSLLANIYYKKHDIKKAIENYELLVADSPTSVMYSVNLAKLYVNQWQIKKAGTVLNNLVKNNPEALNDDRVKQLQLFMFFGK